LSHFAIIIFHPLNHPPYPWDHCFFPYKWCDEDCLGFLSLFSCLFYHPHHHPSIPITSFYFLSSLSLICCWSHCC
jgi:hypothetical protein